MQPLWAVLGWRKELHAACPVREGRSSSYWSLSPLQTNAFSDVTNVLPVPLWPSAEAREKQEKSLRYKVEGGARSLTCRCTTGHPASFKRLYLSHLQGTGVTGHPTWQSLGAGCHGTLLLPVLSFLMGHRSGTERKKWVMAASLLGRVEGVSESRRIWLWKGRGGGVSASTAGSRRGRLAAVCRCGECCAASSARSGIQHETRYYKSKALPSFEREYKVEGKPLLHIHTSHVRAHPATHGKPVGYRDTAITTYFPPTESPDPIL